MSNYEKTADEMFQELGYERGTCYGVTCFRRLSEKEIHFAGPANENGENGYLSAWAEDRCIGFSGNEILACAQLIKEMNENG